MIAQFEDVTVGARLGAGHQILVVDAKDERRIDLRDDADPTRTVSYYAREFDERAFEVIPPPEPKARRYATGGVVTQFPARLVGE